jgi:hypothetical protein
LGVSVSIPARCPHRISPVRAAKARALLVAPYAATFE